MTIRLYFVVLLQEGRQLYIFDVIIIKTMPASQSGSESFCKDFKLDERVGTLMISFSCHFGENFSAVAAHTTLVITFVTVETQDLIQ